MTERRAALRPRPTWLVAVVVVLQLATLLTYVASGLLAPPYAVVLLLTTWLALTVVAARTLRRRGALALAMPLLTIAVWAVVMTAGDLLLGWTP